MGLVDILCNLLNGLFLSVFLSRAFTPDTLHLFFTGVLLRDISLSISYLNHALQSTFLRVRRARLESLTISLHFALQPVVIRVRGLDVVLLLNSRPPEIEAARRAWKNDVLFLDAMLRLAKREFFARSHGARAPGQRSGESDDSVASTPYSLHRRLGHWLLNALLRVEVEGLACRFEDAPPPLLFQGVVGFGWAITMQLDSISSCPQQWDSSRRVAEYVYHRGVRVEGFRAFYDAGVARVDGELIFSPVRTEAVSSAADLELVPVCAYVTDGARPFFDVESLMISCLLEGATWRFSSRFSFETPLRLSLDSLQFQSGLRSILRIPLHFLSRLALGAADDMERGSCEKPDANAVVEGFTVAERDQYLLLFKRATMSRMGLAASFLAAREKDLSLEECICFREWCGTLDLLEVWSDARRKADSLGLQAEEMRSFANLQHEFATVFADSESGEGGFAVNDSRWNVEDVQARRPGLSLFFEFCEVALCTQHSSVLDAEQDGGSRCGDIALSVFESRINVFNSSSRGALVVELDVERVLAVAAEGGEILKSSGAPFLMMRFRQDGILSPSVSSMELVSSKCEVRSTARQLQFILDYFVPQEPPLGNIMRRRCLKTIARARRERASRFGIVLPLRSTEQGPVLSVFLQSVAIYAREDLDFLEPSGDSRRSEDSPALPVVGVGFDALSITSVSPPPHAFGEDNVFSVDESWGVVIGGGAFEKDPAGLLVAEDVLSGSDSERALSAIHLNITGIFVEMILPGSAIHACDLAMVRGAVIDMTTVYVGMPYSTRETFRVDNFLAVQWGEARDVRVLSQCLLPFVRCVRAVVKAILRLAERLGSGPTSWSDNMSTTALRLTFPGADKNLLEVVDSAEAVVRGVRRLTGDVHVKLGAVACAIVHPLSVSLPYSSSTPRVFLTAAFQECCIRSSYYSSSSSRVSLQVQELTSEVSRGKGFAQRAVLAPTQVDFGLVQSPMADVASCFEISTSALKFMCQTASLSTLQDIQKLRLGISQDSDGLHAAGEGSTYGNTYLDGAVPSAPRSSSNQESLRPGEPFVLRLNCHLWSSEIQVPSSEGGECAIVQQGHGSELELVRDGDGEWDRICLKGNYRRRLVDFGSGQVRFSSDDKVLENAACSWRLSGVDLRHISVQCVSGSFLSVTDGRVVSAPTAYDFTAVHVRDMNNRRQATTFAKVFIEAIQLSFGGGHSYSVPEKSQPGVIEVYVGKCEATATATGEGYLRRWDVDWNGTFSLIYSDLARRLNNRVDVISPSRIEVRSILESSGNFLVLHGERLKAVVSTEMIRKVAFYVRRFQEQGAVDDSSFFFFTNACGRRLRFRVLSELGDVSNDQDPNIGGVFVAVESTQSIPFALPACQLEPLESSEKNSNEIGGQSPGLELKAGSSGAVSDYDHAMELQVEGFQSVKVQFGRLLQQQLEILSEDGRKTLFFLRVVEDEIRGALSVELLSSIGIQNFLSVPLDVRESGTGTASRLLGCAPAYAIGGGELGVELSRLSFISFNHSKEVQLSEILSLSGGETKLIDCVSPRGTENDAAALNTTGCHTSSNAFVRRLVVSCQLLDGDRFVISVAPFFSVSNSLLTPIEMMIDDHHVISDASLNPVKLPSRLKGAIGGRHPSADDQDVTFIIYVPPVLSGQSVGVCECSNGNRYRLRLREVGGSWGKPISFVHSVLGVPGRGLALKEHVSLGSLGIVEVRVKYASEERLGSLCISVASGFVLKNLCGTPLKISSATRAASLGRLAPRHNIFLMQRYLYFQEPEVGIGLHEDDEWSKRTLRFDTGLAEVVRIPSRLSKSGAVQFHVECTSDNGVNLVTFRPLITLINCLAVGIQIYGGDRQADLFLAIPPMTSAPYHEEHHHRDSVLPSKLVDSVVSGGTLRFAVACSDLKEKSYISVSKSGVFPISTRLSSTYAIIGVRCKVDDSGRYVVQFLEDPPYGPAISVLNMSCYTILLSSEPLAEPICVCNPGGRAGFAWRSYPNNREFFLSVRDANGRQSNTAAMSLAALGDALGKQTRVMSLTLDGERIILPLVWQVANGFMISMQIGEQSYVSVDESGSAIEGYRAGDGQFNISAHCVLPRIAIQVADLVSVSLTGCGVSFAKSSRDEGRMLLSLGIQGFDVKNKSSKNPVHRHILTRATRGDHVEESCPLVSVSSVVLLPHSILNPSDLLHFERCIIDFQPVVLNLESRFIDRLVVFVEGLFLILHSLRSPHQPDIGKAWSLDNPLAESLGTIPLTPSGLFDVVEEVGVWGRMPLYFDTDAVCSPIVCTFTFLNNGGLRLGRGPVSDRSRLSSLLRVLVVSTIPPIKEATLRFYPPAVASKVFLSGELSRTIGSSVARQWLQILRQLLPNVALLSTIETVVLGRQKGEENTRRLGRARAGVRRAKSAIGRHESMPRQLRFSSASSSSLGDDLARFDSADKLARLVEESEDDDSDAGTSTGASTSTSTSIRAAPELPDGDVEAMQSGTLN